MPISEERVNIWAQALSETEETKCQNAIRLVTEALREKFGNSVTIIHQGSHKNRTNVRVESDVDIAVVYDNIYFSDINALTLADRGAHLSSLTTPSYTFEQFKSDVHEALNIKFGVVFTARKNKCIRVTGNTYRVHADVVPTFVLKRYASLNRQTHTGIGFITDNGGSVIHSYPQLHYDNGVQKNTRTSQSYKAVVRILKNVRNELVDAGIIARDSMPSFFLECLVWNAPDSCFQNATYREDARTVIAKIWGDMRTLATSNDYKEVSEMKWLLREAHRTPAQAEAFMLAAWNYLEP
jgi:predicted nucleotidyltransferase